MQLKQVITQHAYFSLVKEIFYGAFTDWIVNKMNKEIGF